MPSLTAIDAILPPKDLPLAHTGSPAFALDAAASKAARQASIATGARSGEREPRSM